jgi:hypothetical protein
VLDLPRSVLISGISAIVLLLAVFLDWYSVTVSLSGAGVSGLSRSASASGWDTTDVAKLVALLALVAIAAWAIEFFVKDITLPVPALMIAGGAGAVSALLVLFRIIEKPGGAHSASFSLPTAQLHVDVGTSFGIWLALLASIGVVVGAYMRLQES